MMSLIQYESNISEIGPFGDCAERILYVGRDSAKKVVEKKKRVDCMFI